MSPASGEALPPAAPGSCNLLADVFIALRRRWGLEDAEAGARGEEGADQVQAGARIGQVVCSPRRRIASEVHGCYEGSFKGVRERRSAVSIELTLRGTPRDSCGS